VIWGAPLLLCLATMKLARPLLLSVLEDAVRQRTREGGAWLEAIAAATTTPDAFASAFANASRRTSRSALALTPDDVARLGEVGVTWSLGRWALDDLARAALLLRADELLDGRELASLVDRAYRQGDTRERQAVLRALPLLREPACVLPVAIEAARSGIPPLFEAIACENPFPAMHFPALSFNHLILQALMTGVALDRIVGLGARVTPDLVRAVNDFAAERRAAGRRVPADIDAITEAARVVAA
jgi:hypothetical protein